MKTTRNLLIIVVTLMLFALVSCHSDNDDDATSPSTILDVSGLWNFVGQLVQDACGMNASAGGFNGTFQFNQSGTTVTTPRIDMTVGGTGLYFYYSGTVSGKNVSLAALDPYVFTSGSQVIHLGSGIDIQNIENNVGQGTLNLTGQIVQGGTGSCQTIWNGTWTKQ